MGQRVVLLSYLAFLVGIGVFVACGGDRSKSSEPVEPPACGECACTDCECAAGEDCFCKTCACAEADADGVTPPDVGQNHDHDGGPSGGCDGGPCSPD